MSASFKFLHESSGGDKGGEGGGVDMNKLAEIPHAALGIFKMLLPISIL